ncbi:MAG TPA: argininosuccinate lyase, partial [Nitrospirales bacterium]|nr:argininosuccinate lyase [Nitrospirales bacterium]
RGVPFREAHHIVGRMVRFCSDHHRKFTDFTLKELQTFASQFDKGAIEVLTVEGSLKRKSAIGGTARKRVEKRLAVLEKALQREAN